MLSLILILTFLLACLVLYGAVLNSFLKIENYEIPAEGIAEDTTLVLLTDLHACEHGHDYDRLLAMIDSVQPAFICIAGDMTVRSGRNTDRVLLFLSGLSERYPIYYAPGNHEAGMLEYDIYRQSIQEMGICFLTNHTVRTESGFCITGLDLPEYWYHKCWEKRDFTKKIMTELVGTPDSGNFNILLAHNPEYFEEYAAWGADLTLSGHIHGGIARLPLLGGVLSPSLRLFPRYDAGKFVHAGRYMVLSRGLGLHHIKLRFFNRPEISKITLKKSQNG